MKRALTAILAIGLIGTQFYAAFADDSRVPKSAYAKEWTKPKQQNVKETIKTTGFTAPAERTFIYYDPQRGAIDEILVKKGNPSSPAPRCCAIAQTPSIVSLLSSRRSNNN